MLVLHSPKPLPSCPYNHLTFPRPTSIDSGFRIDETIIEQTTEDLVQSGVSPIILSHLSSTLFMKLTPIPPLVLISPFLQNPISSK